MIFIIFICCVLVFLFLKETVLKKTEKPATDNHKTAWIRYRILLKIVANIILLFLLAMVLFLLFMMSPVQWANPKQFNEDTVDLIRVFSLLGFCVNVVLIGQNKKNKIFFCLVLVTDIYMVYKVIRTFLIF